MLKNFLLSTCLVASSLAPLLSHATEWPTRTVKIITNLPVGSRPDVVFRLTAEELSAKWKQPVVVENRPGAGGAVAMTEFDRESAQNNHLILAVDGTAITTMPILNNREDLLKNIRPIASSYYGELLVVVSTKYSTNEEALNEFRKRPIFGSWAAGSIGHFCGLELASITSQQPPEHVAYKEYGVWYTDLHNQAFPLSCSTYGSAAAMIESGKLRVLATTADKRSPKLPQVPTVREVTGRNVKIEPSYLGYFVYNKLDKKIADKIEHDLIEASKSATVVNSIDTGHGTLGVMGSAEFAKSLESAKKLAAQVIQKHQIKLN